MKVTSSAANKANLQRTPQILKNGSYEIIINLLGYSNL